MSENSTDISPNPYDDPSIPYVEPPENPLFQKSLEMMKQDKIFRNLNVNLSVISVAGGLIVLSIIAAMWLYEKRLVNRVSLRLAAVISLVDILTGIAVIEYSTYVARDTLKCTFIAWAMSFCPQLYLFLTVMIAFNLQ
ncbi:409_t:CDS:1, partial [Acaulospora morrowiae]